MDEYKYTGLWWLPFNPEERIAGTLTFSRETGAVLETIGSFKEIIDFGRTINIPIILGATRESSMITLENCDEIASHFGTITTQRYKCSVAYIGGHFATKEDLVFHKAKVQYANLAEWMGKNTFGVKRVENKETNKAEKFEISYYYPEDMLINLDEGYIRLSFLLNTESHFSQEYNLRQTIEVEVKPNKSLHFRDYLTNFLYPFQNFLSLATSRASYINEIKVYSPNVVLKGIDKKIHEIPITILVSLIEGKRKKVNKADMLFTANDIEERFSYCISRWFKTYKNIKDVHDLFFSIEYSPFMYIEEQFLNVLNALETYHRICYRNFICSQEEHESRLSTIMESVNDSYRNWLKEVLAYSNEPRLGRRLKELIEDCTAISPILGDKKKFVRTVVDTRNFFIHRDNSLREHAVSGNELYDVILKLVLIMKYCLLREIGFENEQISQFLERDWRYKTLLLNDTR